MATEPPYYSTIVLFGKEHDRSVASAELFKRLAGSLGAFMRGAGAPPLKSRGRIAGERDRNLAPRKGAFSDKTIDNWAKALPSGRFVQFEIFDGAWDAEHFPAAYAAINKLWGYGPDGYVERTRHGAENNVTLALRSDLAAERMDEIEAHARELASLCSAFYGFIEPRVGWDRERVEGGARYDMIDLRWHDRTAVDYRNGAYSMDAMVPRLYWANLFSLAHFAGGDPGELPRTAVDRVEKWADDRFYVRFTRDPQADEGFHRELEPYFNLVPSGGA